MEVEQSEKIPPEYEDQEEASTQIDTGEASLADWRAETEAPMLLCPEILKDDLVQEDSWQEATEPPPEVYG